MTLETFSRANPRERQILFGKSPLRFYSKKTGVDNYSILAELHERQHKAVLARRTKPTELADGAREALEQIRDIARAKNRLPAVPLESDVCRFERTLSKKHKERCVTGEHHEIKKLLTSCWLWNLGERVLAHRVFSMFHDPEEFLRELEKKRVGELGLTKRVLFDLLASSEDGKERNEIVDLAEFYESKTGVNWKI